MFTEQISLDYEICAEMEAEHLQQQQKKDQIIATIAQNVSNPWLPKLNLFVSKRRS